MINKNYNTEELDVVDEEIRLNILKWKRPEGKDFYITPDGQCVHTLFQPTRNQSDAMYLFSQFERIDLEKENNKYYACVYTGTVDPKCEYGGELIFFIASDSLELAISLAAYESIQYYKNELKR